MPEPNKQQNQDQNPEEQRKTPGIILLLLIGMIIMFMFWALTNHTPSDTKELSYIEFLDMLRGDKVPFKNISQEENLLSGEFIEGGWEEPKPEEGQTETKTYKRYKVLFPHGFLQHPDGLNEIRSFARKNDIPYRNQPSNQFWQIVLAQSLPFLLLILIVWFLFFRRMGLGGGPGGVLSFGNSKARRIGKEKLTVTFDDVAGAKEAKEEVQEIIIFLKDPDRFKRVGGRIPKGVLLVGPPGTGKTLIAKAIAGEADVPFFTISGSDFVEMFVGVGASRVRDLFKQAKEASPSIIFLDEIDAVGRRRGTGLGGGHDEREQTLNAILVEMDGFDTDTSVIVLAASNRPDVLDPALLRPGRFDREVVVGLPDVKGREQILRVHAKKVKIKNPDVLAVIAKTTPGYSGAELEAVINEAAIRAVMNEKAMIELEDLEEARDKVRYGRQRISAVRDEADNKLTAYHEAGHAIVARNLEHAEPVHKVSIIPRGMAGGVTMFLPEKDNRSFGLKYLQDMICVMFGGRVAEEIFLGDISAGAQNDIERATDIARRMVCEWGMSEEVGPINFGNNQETLFLGREVTRTTDHSEDTARMIDNEIKRIIVDNLERAREIINQHKEETEQIAKALLELETISGDDVDRLLKDGATVADLVAERKALDDAAAIPAAPPQVLKPIDPPPAADAGGNTPAPEPA